MSRSDVICATAQNLNEKQSKFCGIKANETNTVLNTYRFVSNNSNLGTRINKDIDLDTNIVPYCDLSVENTTFDTLSPERLWGCEHFQWQAVRVSVDPNKKHTFRQ